MEDEQRQGSVYERAGERADVAVHQAGNGRADQLDCDRTHDFGRCLGLSQRRRGIRVARRHAGVAGVAADGQQRTDPASGSILHPSGRRSGNPQIVYVSFGGYRNDNLWKTSDGGATWKRSGSTFPEAPIRAIAIHPVKRNFVYVGTEVGVFASEDGGATWSPTNEGPTNCSVDDLFWMGNTLVAVTHGRGMFSISIPPS